MSLLKNIWLLFVITNFSCEPINEELSLIENTVRADTKINGANVLSTHKLTGSNSDNFDLNEQTNANWVALAPIIEVRKDANASLFFDANIAANISKIVKNILPQGIDYIMLKPQISFQSLGFDFWGDFRASSEKEWIEIETSFQELLLAYAETSLTNPAVKILCIGNELKNFTKLRPDFFKNTTILIKEKYPNLLLTYAANWDEYEHINFWNELDYIGINPYFPLVNSATATVNQIENAYDSIKIKLNNLSANENKPILFTEYGFRSIDYATWKSWKLPPFYESALNYNPEIQVNGYNAFYNTFWAENWVAGGFFWVWEIISQSEINLGLQNTYLNSDWSVNYKPVVDVIKENYSK